VENSFRSSDAQKCFQLEAKSQRLYFTTLNLRAFN